MPQPKLLGNVHGQFHMCMTQMQDVMSVVYDKTIDCQATLDLTSADQF